MKSLMKAIGQKAIVHAFQGVSIEVRVTDVKVAWGKVRFEVTPCAGVGSAWVEQLRFVDINFHSEFTAAMQAGA